MTYFQFLALFLGIPLLLTGALHLNQFKRDRYEMPRAFRTWNWINVTLGLIAVAVIWTTPWDNYLVATEVWWYDPALVSGYLIGYVPVEEYTFFILQTALTSAITVWMIKQFPNWLIQSDFQPNKRLVWGACLIVALIWFVSTYFLIIGYLPATYLTLILSWALIPIGIQLAFGADILWHYRRLLFWAIVPITLYLAAADSLAIRAGTWTISEEQTVGVILGSVLPLEEFTFFFITNVLVVFGITLLLARQSHERSADMPYLKNLVATDAHVDTT